MKKILLSCFILLSAMTFSNEVKIFDTNEAVTEALNEFKRSQSADVIDTFTGIKAWPVTGGVKAKIYLKDKKSISYSCHRHHDDEPFECH